MIKGIGIDIVEIKRVERLIRQYGPRFINRTFTKKEIKYCQDRPNPAQHYAGRFAVKEALIKAFGKPLTLKEIEIDPSPIPPRPSGRVRVRGPKIKLTGKARLALRNKKILFSISHDYEYAVAQVILE